MAVGSSRILLLVSPNPEMDKASFPVGTSSSLLAKSVVMKDLWAPSSRSRFACKLDWPELMGAIAVFKSTCPCEWVRDECN